ncbi:MAG: CRTAC1 family protein [Verrucomicrobiota bacterium]
MKPLPALSFSFPPWCCSAFGILLLCARHAWSADSTLPGQSFNPAGPTEPILRALEDNRKRQWDDAKSWTVFHDFAFDDHYEESGIRFFQHPVEDAAKNYKAVHYDHGSGLAVADVDNDGRLDLYFVNQLGGNQLWRNLGHGKFENITAQSGVGLEDKICVSASFADIDNDGWIDLFVTTVRMGNVLVRNLGQGKFEDITTAAGLKAARPAHSSGAVFFDYDRDGLLDLFVTNVGIYTRNERGEGGFYLGRSDAFQGWQFPARSEQSILYHNSGQGRFEDVSAKAGLLHRGWSGDATFCDLNGDGYPDLYVLSMSGEDTFYENQAGRQFVDKTAVFFGKTPWGSMGVKFFDYNLDGHPDLFVTDMHSDMTVAQIKAGDTDLTPAFEKRKSDAWCSTEWTPVALQRASNCILGNAFYRNQGQGRMDEISAAIGTESYWPWGVTVADFNADGYEDIFITAGMGYPLRYAVNSLLLNDAGTRFRDSEFVLGIEPRKGHRIESPAFVLDCSGRDARHPLAKGKSGRWTVMGATSSRSSAAFDLDDDGDLDLVTNDWNDHPQVLTSNLSEKRPVRFLKIRLIGTASNRDGLGALVKVRCGPATYTRYHDGKSGYLSQSSMPLYFGLGEATNVDELEVVWPSGKRQTVPPPLAISSLLTIREANP